MQKIHIKSSQKNELIDITLKIKEIIAKSSIKEGICIIYTPHTTSAIIINENSDPNVKKDIINELSKLIPKNNNYLHSEGNSDSHIKSSILGNEKTIVINNGKLLLGTWQGIMFFEGDGPREREIIIKIMGD